MHPDHVCDGIKQCPHHDDELVCSIQCPALCLCQGWAYVCPRSFQPPSRTSGPSWTDLPLRKLGPRWPRGLDVQPHFFPQLCLVDASQSNMHPNSFSNNSLLEYPRLSDCRIIDVTIPKLPNLQTLDLSANVVTEMNVAEMKKLDDLLSINLSYNPLTKVYLRKFSTTTFDK